MREWRQPISDLLVLFMTRYSPGDANQVSSFECMGHEENTPLQMADCNRSPATSTQTNITTTIIKLSVGPLWALAVTTLLNFNYFS